MPTTAIPGFVKKRTASQRFKRSPRQLTRDITVAMEMQDENVLQNLKLRTEDGNILDGMELTAEKIKQLKEEGANPTWYLRKSWLVETFGSRESPAKIDREPTPEADAPVIDSPSDEAYLNEGIVGLMKETIRELKKDKELLNRQLEIKDQQITSANAIALESNVREKEYTRLLKEFAERIPRMEAVNQQTSRGEHNIIQSAEDNVQPRSSEEIVVVAPIKKSQATKPAGRQSNKNTRSARNKKKYASSTKKPTSKWYEMPTFRRIVSR